MALGKAIEFIRKIGHDQGLRMHCNSVYSKNELLAELGFNEDEFEEAITMQLVKCQSYEEAQHTKEIQFWFSLL